MRTTGKWKKIGSIINGKKPRKLAVRYLVLPVPVPGKSFKRTSVRMVYRITPSSSVNLKKLYSIPKLLSNHGITYEVLPDFVV